LGKYKPFKMDLPLTMSLKLTLPKMVDLISLVPNVKRLSIDEVSYVADDVPGMLRMFRVMLGLAWSQR
jgi:D-aminopeptidase